MPRYTRIIHSRRVETYTYYIPRCTLISPGGSTDAVARHVSIAQIHLLIQNAIFSTAQTNKSDYNQISAAFCTSDTFEMQKTTAICP